MAHIKSGASTKGNRDSIGKRLGVKLFAGEKVFIGNIIVRQKGTKFHSGEGTNLAKDFSIYAIRDGYVNFRKKLGKTLVEVVSAKT